MPDSYGPLSISPGSSTGWCEGSSKHSSGPRLEPAPPSAREAGTTGCDGHLPDSFFSSREEVTKTAQVRFDGSFQSRQVGTNGLEVAQSPFPWGWGSSCLQPSFLLTAGGRPLIPGRLPSWAAVHGGNCKRGFLRA